MVRTVFTPYEPKFGDGELFSKSNQILAGLEMNYKLSDTIDLTSVTGFYRSAVINADQFATYPVAPILNFGSVGLPALVAFVQFKHRQISQEFRANSSFDGPLNFTAGGIYTGTRSSSGSHAFGNASNPVEVAQYLLTQDGTAYSVFGQARFDVTPQLELSAGGRYSKEKKNLPVALADFTGSRENITGPAVSSCNLPEVFRAPPPPVRPQMPMP